MRQPTEIPVEIVTSPKFSERFWRRVVKADGCWDWTGQKNQAGYGQIELMVRGRRYCFLAHRIQWVMENGPIPERMVVMHTCDNPSCSNPAHLRLGTMADNSADAMAKGRMRKGFVGPWRGKKGVLHPNFRPINLEVIRLRFEERYPPADIARIVGASVHSVRYDLRRHLAALGQANRRVPKKTMVARD